MASIFLAELDADVIGLGEDCTNPFFAKPAPAAFATAEPEVAHAAQFYTESLEACDHIDFADMLAKVRASLSFRRARRGARCSGERC